MADANWENKEMVMRYSTRYHHMTEEQRCIIDKRFEKFINDERSDDDDDDFGFDVDVEDNDDLTYQPNLDIDDSDVEVIDELNEDDIEEFKIENFEAFLAFKNAKELTKVSPSKSPSKSKIRSQNVIDNKGMKPGPVKNICDPYTIFRTLITEEMANIIINETNRKGKEVTKEWNLLNPEKAKEWRPMTLQEFDAFLAIVLYAGLTKSNSEPAFELWGPTHPPIYKAALSYDRFLFIKKFIRFDSANSRQKRLTKSKTAVIDGIWKMLQDNLKAAYIPYDSLAIDEQLFPFRRHTRFTQYIPTKIAKYGIKIFWLCDSKSFYPLNGIVYSGKLTGQNPKKNEGQIIFNQLVENYVNTGRKVYTGINTMDQILATYSCKRSTDRWSLAMFYNMLDIAALAAFVIYDELKPLKKADKRRSFLQMLTHQLALSNIEERAKNPRITGYPKIRSAMEAFNVKIVVSRPTEGIAPSFAPRTNRPSCRLCSEEHGRRRKTRAYCFSCNKPVCAEHSTLLHRCNACRIELENSQEDESNQEDASQQ